MLNQQQDEQQFRHNKFLLRIVQSYVAIANECLSDYWNAAVQSKGTAIKYSPQRPPQPFIFLRV